MRRELFPGYPTMSPKDFKILRLSLGLVQPCNKGILSAYSFNEWTEGIGTSPGIRVGELKAVDEKQLLAAFTRSEPFGRDSSVVYFMVQPDFKGLWGSSSQGFSWPNVPHHV